MQFRVLVDFLKTRSVWVILMTAESHLAGDTQNIFSQSRTSDIFWYIKWDGSKSTSTFVFPHKIQSLKTPLIWEPILSIHKLTITKLPPSKLLSGEKHTCGRRHVSIIKVEDYEISRTRYLLRQFPTERGIKRTKWKQVNRHIPIINIK